MYKNGKNITFIDRGVYSVKAFLDDARKTKPLTKEQERLLWQQMKQGSVEARNILVNSNLRFVITDAKKYLPSGVPLEDLIMAGCEGMVKAVDKFDASLNFRFISFAQYYIENEIRKEAYDHLNHDYTSIDDNIVNNSSSNDLQLADTLKAEFSYAADWGLRYDDKLRQLVDAVESRQGGAGAMLTDYLQMRTKGFTDNDFIRKYNLNNRQLTYFLDIVKECFKLTIAQTHAAPASSMRQAA